MTERIKITNSRILIKDANNTTKFDTNNFYLKTDVNGNLKIAGYSNTPSVYGMNTGASSIQDYGNGGLMLDPSYGYVPAGTGSFILRVPAYNTIKLLSYDNSLSTYYGGNITYYFGEGFISPTKTASFRSAETNNIILTTTFNWMGDWGNTTPLFDAWQNLASLYEIRNFNPPTSDVPGQWEFPIQTVQSMTDWYNLNFSTSQSFYNYLVQQDSYNTGPISTRIANVNVMPMTPVTTKTAITLSIATTQ